MSLSLGVAEVRENAALQAQQRTLQELLGRTAIDQTLRQRMLSEPAAVLAEHGITFPEGFTIKCIENEHDATIVLPDPVDEIRELDDNELQQVNGGGSLATASPLSVTTAFCIGVTIGSALVTTVIYTIKK